MNELNDMLAATGLKPYTIVMTFAAFKLSEHEDAALVKDYGMDNEKDYGKVLFFDGDCYIQEFEHETDLYGYVVRLQNHEYHFTEKDSAIRHLYCEHYLIEHLGVSEKLHVIASSQNGVILTSDEIEPTAKIHYALISVWENWCEREGIPLQSADEMLHSHYMDDEDTYTEPQRRFIETYSKLWSLEHD